MHEIATAASNRLTRVRVWREHECMLDGAPSSGRDYGYPFMIPEVGRNTGAAKIAPSRLTNGATEPQHTYEREMSFHSLRE